MICSLPWVHLSLQARDDAVGIRPCCWYLHSSVKKEFPNQWLTYNDVKRIGLTEASNSQVLKKTRQDMLAGKHVSGCQSCYDSEKIGNFSMRQNFNSKFKLDNLLDLLKRNGFKCSIFRNGDTNRLSNRIAGNIYATKI